MESVIKYEILNRINHLMDAYREGKLGGEIMPEDANPGLTKDCVENYLYFSLPMSLNYQRNSYALWKSACQSYLDDETHDIFSPLSVSQMDIALLREKLLKYKVALQPNKQPVIWKTICTSISNYFDGDVRSLFTACDYSVIKTKRFIMERKRDFPYLSGEKILNYWLYIMQSFTDLSFYDRSQITIAPDTHVIQASIKLGIITEEQSVKSDARQIVAVKWDELLQGTTHQPIDVHTPLWLWSRGNFSVEV